MPLIAANLSNADAARIVKGGDAAVFDAARITQLGLGGPSRHWQAAHEREIDAGQCRALPPAAWPRMARAQLAHDAVMAEVLREQAGGMVLLGGGNGQLHRDMGRCTLARPGVGRAGSSPSASWRRATARRRSRPSMPWLRTAPAARADPCADFRPSVEG